MKNKIVLVTGSTDGIGKQTEYKESESSPYSHNIETRKKLWELSLQLAKFKINS